MSVGDFLRKREKGTAGVDIEAATKEWARELKYKSRNSKMIQDRYDNVHNPAHYNSHPSGVECIEITKHMNFCLGNAMKYIWRADLKNDAIEDLKKAKWYIECEIQRREGHE